MLSVAELTAQTQIAKDFLRLAETEDDPLYRVVGHRQMGSNLYYLGELAPARDHLERALKLYAPGERQSLLTAISGFDTRAVSLSSLSLVLLGLGYPDQALSQSEKSVEWARELKDPHVLAYTLAGAARHAILRRALSMARKVLEEMIALTTEQRLRFWLPPAQIDYGYVLAAYGDRAAGLELSQEALSQSDATGAALFKPFYLSLIAQTCESMGQLDEAMQLTATALAAVERTGERNHEAELHRLRGEWISVHHLQEHAEAEASLQRALAVARNQSARLWELRASTSLARLWRDQDKRTEARDLLAPIYGWFTEGFDTPDLKEAKALLGELAL